MVCKRIISVLTFNQGTLYRTKRFHPDYVYTSQFLDFWWADEVISLDITRHTSNQSRSLFHERLQDMSKNCFVPLAAGGGIATLNQVDDLFQLGVDKVVLNTHALQNPTFISEVAGKYGSQAVVVAIDAMKEDNKTSYAVYKSNGSIKTNLSPSLWAKQAVEYGAGEIMITSIKEDGSLNGYDQALCREVIHNVNVPVLISGGAGNWKHFEQGLVDLGADAVCTTNIYHFTEASMLNAKKYLSEKNISVRL
jgi:cyclase